MPFSLRTIRRLMRCDVRPDSGTIILRFQIDGSPVEALVIDNDELYRVSQRLMGQVLLHGWINSVSHICDALPMHFTSTGSTVSAGAEPRDEDDTTLPPMFAREPD